MWDTHSVLGRRAFWDSASEGRLASTSATRWRSTAHALFEDARQLVVHRRRRLIDGHDARQGCEDEAGVGPQEQTRLVVGVQRRVDLTAGLRISDPLPEERDDHLL